jgi:hypothetical protein
VPAKRKVFFSFHYQVDAWRVQQVLKMGKLEGQPILTPNQWEAVKRGGRPAIVRWIAGQMRGKSCLVVLIGPRTARRPWVDYEIEKAWTDGRGVVGVYIHSLKNSRRQQALKGANPFDHLYLDSKKFSSIVKAYNPPRDSKAAYTHIESNLANWVDEAIRIRKRHP